MDKIIPHITHPYASPLYTCVKKQRGGGGDLTSDTFDACAKSITFGWEDRRGGLGKKFKLLLYLQKVCRKFLIS